MPNTKSAIKAARQKQKTVEITGFGDKNEAVEAIRKAIEEIQKAKQSRNTIETDRNKIETYGNK